MEETFYTPKEVAELLKVAETTTWKWIRDGHLKAIQISGHVYRIPASALRDFITSRTVNT